MVASCAVTLQTYPYVVAQPLARDTLQRASAIPPRTSPCFSLWAEQICLTYLIRRHTCMNIYEVRGRVVDVVIEGGSHGFPPLALQSILSAQVYKSSARPHLVWRINEATTRILPHNTPDPTSWNTTTKHETVKQERGLQHQDQRQAVSRARFED